MAGHGGSSAGSYLADPTSPPHCASIVVTSTLRVKYVMMEERNLKCFKCCEKIFKLTTCGTCKRGQWKCSQYGSFGVMTGQ